MTLDPGPGTSRPRRETPLAGFLTAIPRLTGGALVALDVRDGGVLAMVSQPYDAASFLRRLCGPVPGRGPPPDEPGGAGALCPGSHFVLVAAAP